LSPNDELPEIAVDEAIERVAGGALLIDVREQDEWDAGHITGATLIPSSQLQSRWQEIPTDKTVIVYCRSGNRSNAATDFLKQQGLNNVHNMLGGVVAWEAAGLALEK